MLLAYVFENFRHTAMATYGLDPAHYYTLPGYSWDALLKCTNVTLELIIDPDMYLFIEKGLRGGISMVSQRHAKAINPCMENYDKDKPTSYTQYLDANNIYGWAMSQPMPTEAFQWVDYSERILQTPADADHGYILKVDLEYPASLHAEHNDYPLAPEKMAVTKDMMSSYQQKLVEDLELGAASFNCKKLVPNLMPKQRCRTQQKLTAIPVAWDASCQSPQSSPIQSVCLDGPLYSQEHPTLDSRHQRFREEFLQAYE